MMIGSVSLSNIVLGLLGEYGRAFSAGLQQGDINSNSPARPLQAVATLKHVSAYSLEDWSPSGNFSDHTYTRGTFNAVVCNRDLSETYLPAFERAIRHGGALGIMYSCSELNGVPGIDSAFLRNQVPATIC